MKLEEILKDIDNIDNNLESLLEIIPEIKYMINFDQKHPHHHLDVWEHTKLALSLSRDDFTIRLTLLLHDIGKPFSYQEVNNIRHFKNHPIKSEKMSREILKRLNYNDKFIEEICYLIKYHDTPINQIDINTNYDLELKRYEVQKCDALAHNPEYLDKRINYLNKTKKLFKN